MRKNKMMEILTLDFIKLKSINQKVSILIILSKNRKKEVEFRRLC